MRLNRIVWPFSILLVICVLLVAAKGFDVKGYDPAATPAHRQWWRHSASPFESEGFQGSASQASQASPLLDQPAELEQKESELLEHAPGKPAPVDLYRDRPYHLLSDRLGPPRDQETLSCVNSRSCYAVDAEAHLSKVGNYRQLTNNYKREYPDNCSALRQELVLNFYKAEPVSVSGR